MDQEKTGDRYFVIKSYPCGCEISHKTNLYSLDESYGITYCPLHKAAPDMCEALKFTVRQIQELHSIKGDFGLTNAVLGLANQVLAEVAGEE